MPVLVVFKGGDFGRIPMDAMQEAIPQITEKTRQAAVDEAPKVRGLAGRKSLASRIVGLVQRARTLGIVRSKAPHSHLVILGTKAHPLKGGTGKRKGPFKKAMTIFGDKSIVRSWAMHPGSRSNQFLERAEAKVEPEAMRIMDMAILRSIFRQEGH